MVAFTPFILCIFYLAAASASSVSRQIELGDCEYFVPPTAAWKLDSWDTSAEHEDEFTPLTVVRLNQTVNAASIASALTKYAEVDDVWTPSFAKTLHVGAGSDDLVKHLPAKYNVSAVFTGRTSAPPGPYFVHSYTGNVYQAYRLYDDNSQAFIQSTYQDPSGTHQPLRAATRSAGGLTVAVPSRLYFTQTREKPLAGLRISIQDLFDLKGAKTSGGSRALYETSEIKTETAVAAQKLIDAGAVVVGKAKLSEFSFAGPYITDHIDYLLPFNPRGDGYNSPGDSSGGSAAAVASYEWLDASLCSDTGGSIRGPAMQNAIHGNRPTQDAVNLAGSLPLASSMDTAGVMARDPIIWSKINKALYAGTIKEYAGLPSEILLDENSKPMLKELQDISPDAAAAAARFLDGISQVLSTNITSYSLDDGWGNSTPKSFGDDSIVDIVDRVYSNLTLYEQWVEFGKDFLETYQRSHNNAFPYIFPFTLGGWMQANKTMTETTYEDDLASKKGVQDWVAGQVFTPDSRTCSSRVFVYFTTSSPNYKLDVFDDWANPYIGQLYNEIYDLRDQLSQLNETIHCNSTLGTEETCQEAKDASKSDSTSTDPVPPARFASVAGVPDYAVTLGTFDMGDKGYSNSSHQIETVPLAVNIMAGRGCDFVILDIVEELHRKGIVKTVKTGKEA
ncbi:hypothetical protein F66182_4979 [Fusarium sp. NRRL 66182]|nr:hypothetical protein F66182_4979 [Fusarium sp. NRRL 66182]